MTTKGINTNGHGELAKRVEALSPRRLMLLTGLFVLAFGAILFSKHQEESKARRTETSLIVNQAASNCASDVNVAIMTGESVRQTISGCYPGGIAALYHLSAVGDIITAYGETSDVDLALAVSRSLPLDAIETRVLDLPTGKARAAWRPLDNNDALLVAAPADDIYQRPPLWITYALMLAAVGMVSACLMAAFIRQSQAAARAAEAVEALRDESKALSSGRAGIWSFDPKNRTVSLQRQILEPLGLGARDRVFTMREMSALAHPQDLRSLLAILTGDTSGITEGTIRLRHPDAGWSRAYFRTDPAATRHERSGVALDLTSSHSFSAGEALAEARLKDAIENIPEAFVLWDASGRLAAWNGRFASVMRVNQGALHQGMTASEVAELSRGASDALLSYFAPDAAINEQSVEVALPRDYWLHISRRRTGEGGMVCVGSNVTDLKRRARAQKKKERELQAVIADLEGSRRELTNTMRDYQLEKHRAEEASRSKSEFLANMSHELRTPLNAINGFSEIMQSELYGPLGDPKYREYVDDILSSGQHLLELIEDVLDMSKIETGRMTLEPRRVELERILQECGRLVAKRARDAGVKLTISVGHAPAVWADARAVKQIALNLLSNAVKFTPSGGEVTLTAEADLDGVTIIVADSGVGIARENLTRLGAPFEIVDDGYARSRHGSGLGLALSNSLVELMGGILAIASQPNKGTVACACLPRRKDAKVRLPQFVRDEAHVLTRPAQGQTGLTIDSEPAVVATVTLKSHPREAAE